MAPVVRNLFQIRSHSFFGPNLASLGVLPSICEALHKYELLNYFYPGSPILFFHHMRNGKRF